jgi:PQQ-dependent dehydrogenase (methanol/ethanol family)
VRKLSALALFLILSVARVSYAQALDPAKMLKPPTDTWPTYNGDYSGRRFSPLTQINKLNVNTLSLAWAFQSRTTGLQAMPLEVDGILYVAGGNQAWAIDARTGRQVWHFAKPGVTPSGGDKGFAMWHDRLYMTTFDAQLLCLDAKDGKMLWQIQVADPALKAFGGVAPLVIRDHIIIGTSGDTADLPGFLLSVDPMTGKIEWRWDAMPQPDDTVAWNSWPHDNTDVSTRGGGMTWITGTYDSQLNLLYWGTGNPHPVENSESRPGANLYTCSIVALNPDTGKLAWYFQSSPHDTHDWDTVMTPVLFDGVFKGKPRKMLAQANKNGLFFVLDRTNGKSLISESFVPANWVKGYDDRGQPIPDPDKEPKPDGVLVTGGVGTNWQAPSYDPETGLFYVNARPRASSISPCREKPPRAGPAAISSSARDRCSKPSTCRRAKFAGRLTPKAGAASPASSRPPAISFSPRTVPRASSPSTPPPEKSSGTPIPAARSAPVR